MIRASAIVLVLMGVAAAFAAPVPPAGPELLKAVREARRAGNLDEAEKLLKDYESRKGDPEKAQLEWLLLRAQRGETAAQKELRALLKKKDVDAIPLLEALARGYQADYRSDDAFAVLKEWLERDPKSVDALYIRGSVVLSYFGGRSFGGGPVEDAEPNFRQVVKLQPNYRDAQLRLAEVLAELHRYDDAIPLFERWRESHKDDPRAVVGLARCWYNKGEPDPAKKLLDDYLVKQPKQSAALAERGKIAALLSDTEKAEVLLRQAVAADPSNLIAIYQLGICLRRLGKKEEAAKQETRMRQMEKDARQLQQMIQQLAKSPEDPKVRHEIGVVFARLRQDDEAVRWWKGALREKPDYAPAHRALADYYEKAGKKELAEQHRKLAEEKK